MRLAVLALLVAVAAGNVDAAQPGAVQGKEQHSRRGDLVRALVLKWAPYVQEAYHVAPAKWARGLAQPFARSTQDALRKALDARTFDGMNEALVGTSSSPTITKSLGIDIDKDLVFMPVAPCRLLDTRVAGGAFAAAETRGVDVTAVANYSFQGGDSTDCGVGGMGSFAAAAINFTVVSPTNNGYITAYPYNTTRPLAATMAYKTGALYSSMAIVRLDQSMAASEISLYANSATHVVADIVGYFINPQATALDCVTSPQTVESVAAGGQANVVAGACPAGYTETGTQCQSGSWTMPFVYSSEGICSAQNNGGGAAELRASRKCCRLPGR
ncbi:hypothetical protein GCM10027432_09520 [Lysobacter fragariae]